MKASVLLVVMLASCIFILPACDAAEETEIPVPIIVPGDGENFPVAVYFADNMVFTPQWRIGNFVRIEMMVIDLRGPGGGMQPKDVPSENLNVYEKSELMQDPALIANTRMVSVSHIHVEIVDQEGTIVWSATLGWDATTYAQTDFSDCFRREINKEGFLIYGGQWDTSGMAAGTYSVHVELDEKYSVMYSTGNNKTDLDHPIEILAADPFDPQYVSYDLGIGGVTNDMAWLDLGVLVEKGSKGTQGGGKGGNQGGGKGR